LFFVLFLWTEQGKKPEVGEKVVEAVMRVGVAAVDGCGGGDHDRQLTRSRHEAHGGEDNHLATAMDP
jgi:hypothetical protein